MLAAFQRSLTYFPDRTRPTPADSGVPELSPVTLETEDGLSLLAWYAPPRVSGAPSLAYFHGNAGHIGMRGFKVQAYLNAGPRRPAHHLAGLQRQSGHTDGGRALCRRQGSPRLPPSTRLRR